MNENDYGAFIVQIMKTLEKNGFPANKVALPLERLYESAYQKGLNFNKVLSFLSDKGIHHEKTTEKVIFSAQPTSPPVEPEKEPPAAGLGDLKDMFAGLDLEAFRGKNPADLMAGAMELMKKLSPEQRAAMENLYGGMSDEEKSDIMKKAKDMGLL